MSIAVGTMLPELEAGSLAQRRDDVRALEAAGVDHLAVGDHVSFRGGLGFDGLVHAAHLLALSDRLPVHVGVYLLALRHPVVVVRQLADLTALAPARLVFGVGVGGEDRHEYVVGGTGDGAPACATGWPGTAPTRSTSRRGPGRKHGSSCWTCRSCPSSASATCPSTAMRT